METAKELLSTAVVVGFPEQRLSYLAGSITRCSAQYCVVLAEGSRKLLGLIRFSDVAANSGTSHRILSDLMGALPELKFQETDSADLVRDSFASSQQAEAAVVTGSGDFAGLITRESLGGWLLVREQQLRGQLAAFVEQQSRLMDFSERKVNHQVEQMRRSLGEFENTCMALSHDIRSPLRTISSYADIILKDHGRALTAEVSQLIGRIMVVATKGEAVAQDLLAQARSSLGVKSRTLVAIDLNAIVADAVQFLNAQITAAGAKIQVRGPLHSVRGYYTGTLQVIVNLLANGIKYVPAGRSPLIEVWSETTGPEVNLYLQDNGTGLAIEAPSDALQPNYGEEEQGTGLGLQIVRATLAALGGRLKIASRPGTGTLFTITLIADHAGT